MVPRYWNEKMKMTLDHVEIPIKSYAILQYFFILAFIFTSLLKQCHENNLGVMRWKLYMYFVQALIFVLLLILNTELHMWWVPNILFFGSASLMGQNFSLNTFVIVIEIVFVVFALINIYIIISIDLPLESPKSKIFNIYSSNVILFTIS